MGEDDGIEWKVPQGLAAATVKGSSTWLLFTASLGRDPEQWVGMGPPMAVGEVA